MPKVKLKLFASLRELIDDTKEEEYEVKDGTMLMDLLLEYVPERHKAVSKKWKETLFEIEGNEIKLDDGVPIIKHYLILINGKLHQFLSDEGKNPGFRYKLKDGDIVAILPPMGGG